VQKAIAKTPEARYQTGRELRDDLLAFVRAGNVPTIREVETPTVPATMMQGVSTLAIPATLSEAPTEKDIATRVSATSAPTARPAAGAPAPPPRPSPPAASAPPPLPRVAPPPRPAPPAAAARKSGGGAGLLIGLGVLGLGLAVVVVAGGWFLLFRNPSDAPPTTMAVTPATTPATAPPATAPPASLEPPPTTLATTPTTVVAANVPPPTAPPATAPPPTRAVAPPPTQPPAKPRRAADTRTAAVPTEDDAPAADDGPPNAFLDQEPPAIDGREAGAAVAEGFRSPNTRSGGFGTSRNLQRRELSPAPRSPAENFAIRAVRNVMNAQAAYNQKNGRYGSLADLSRAGVLPLANVQNGNSFMHRAYRFEMDTSGGSYRIVATPREPRGLRAFVGDDSGYIRDAAQE
jgi:hypothetical protein